MSELLFLGDIANLTNPSHSEILTPNIQKKVEAQFGVIPEFHRRYDQTMQCRITRYDPDQGYISFLTVNNTRNESTAQELFSHGVSIAEYQLLNADNKDRVSRWAFLTRDWEGKIALTDAGVYYRQGILDTHYQVVYRPDSDGDFSDYTSIGIFYNQSRDPKVVFPYTELVYAFSHENQPWEVYVAHGGFEQLEAYYRRQREQYAQREHEILRPDLRDRFPGILLQLPQAGSDVLVYEGIKGSTVIREKPKQVDLLELGRPRIVAVRGLYLYTVSSDRETFISRADQDKQDKSIWEITLFNNIETLTDVIKGDWINLKDSLIVNLLVK